ncbi:Hypothetical protein CAP_0037 [Chondromyces apiculatus DSM 436]|uniref:Uncharacterized protein n=1 Tax=Chondromyces apiculatus DSM 436 TaxID=1192034 RepID=A0A017TI46_9BACT|nr:Hypothetical protein CAP_0037 [Chondromyces apiculatus DSM 436]
MLQLQQERPPEGLQRGRYPAPPWSIAALGAAVLLGALLFLGFRARRALKRSEGRDESGSPKRS